MRVGRFLSARRVELGDGLVGSATVPRERVAEQRAQAAPFAGLRRVARLFEQRFDRLGVGHDEPLDEHAETDGDEQGDEQRTRARADHGETG